MGANQIAEFYRSHAEEDSGWYMFPRAMYPNEENLENLQKVFEWIANHQLVKVGELDAYQPHLGENPDSDTYVHSEWTQELQLELLHWMINQEIIRPYAEDQSINDQLANVRNYVNLLRKLGFAFVNQERHLHVSPVGEEFLVTDERGRMIILEKQLLRIQFWNPSIHRPSWEVYRKYQLFPLLFILKLLLELDDGKLTSAEFFLIAGFARKMEDLPEILSLVQEFRALDEDARQGLQKALDPTYPQIANASVHLGAFGLIPALAFEEGALSIQDSQYTRQLVNIYEGRLRFVDYDAFEDWYESIADLEPGMSTVDILRYYIETGKDEAAKQVAQEADDEPGLIAREQPPLQEAVEDFLQERLIEDFLEKRMGVIEEGLELVANGRQFTTEVGRIDLLARDPTGGFVVVELKKGRLEDEVVGQCLRYMGWVRANLSPNNIVRGIIVGRSTSNKLMMAIHGMQHAENKLIKIRQFSLDVQAEMTDI